MIGGKWIVGALMGVAFGAAATHVYAQAEVIEKRQKAMKGISAANKAIKGAIESKDYATVETKAKDIMGTAGGIPELFPKGSTKGKTKATAAIWDKSDDFAAHAKKLGSAAGALAAAAKSTDAAAVDEKAKAVNAACSSCHKSFRAKDYSE